MAGNEDGSEDSQRVVDGHVTHLKISVRYHAYQKIWVRYHAIRKYGSDITLSELMTKIVNPVNISVRYHAIRINDKNLKM